MYENGTVLVYGTSGACTIQGIRTQEYLGEAKDYYVFCLAFEDSTIMVPVNSELLSTKIRLPYTKKQIEDSFLTMDEHPLTWTRDNRARATAFQEIINAADFKNYLPLLNLLIAKKLELATIGKKHLLADEAFFKKVEKLILSEIGLVFGLSKEESKAYLQEHLIKKNEG